MSDKNTLQLRKLHERLEELKDNNRFLNKVDLYGGEIALLKTTYLEDFLVVIAHFGISKINVITNLAAVNPFFLKENVYLTVSYDFDAREKHEVVFQNMCKLDKPFSILMLASPEVLNMNVEYMISFFNSLSLVQSVEIKPYSTNQSNQHDISFVQFENFVKRWIQSPILKKFRFVNEDLVLVSLDHARNAFSDDHLYLTPEGNWAVLDFDKNDHEYFRSLESISEYEKWAQIEKEKVNKNIFCSNCAYKGNCLTEHYRDVKSLKNSCNGLRHLLDWAENHYPKAPQERNSQPQIDFQS